MKNLKITTGGQISLPAQVRHRWGTRSVRMQDGGDYLVLRPIPDDPISAARGAFGNLGFTAAELREDARRDEETASRRKSA